MSAFGQKQTWECIFVMSALPPKADIAGCDGAVRFVWRYPATVRRRDLLGRRHLAPVRLADRFPFRRILIQVNV